ncbi:unnamed protein product [Closterium sp. Naga37s-1]|nr:unnamed protein product [Closterium sp. Naga37s-1]
MGVTGNLRIVHSSQRLQRTFPSTPITLLPPLSTPLVPAAQPRTCLTPASPTPNSVTGDARLGGAVGCLVAVFFLKGEQKEKEVCGERDVDSWSLTNHLQATLRPLPVHCQLCPASSVHHAAAIRLSCTHLPALSLSPPLATLPRNHPPGVRSPASSIHPFGTYSFHSPVPSRAHGFILLLPIPPPAPPPFPAIPEHHGGLLWRSILSCPRSLLFLPYITLPTRSHLFQRMREGSYGMQPVLPPYTVAQPLHHPFLTFSCSLLLPPFNSPFPSSRFIYLLLRPSSPATHTPSLCSSSWWFSPPNLLRAPPGCHGTATRFQSLVPSSLVAGEVGGEAGGERKEWMVGRGARI